MRMTLYLLIVTRLIFFLRQYKSRKLGCLAFCLSVNSPNERTILSLTFEVHTWLFFIKDLYLNSSLFWSIYAFYIKSTHAFFPFRLLLLFQLDFFRYSRFYLFRIWQKILSTCCYFSRITFFCVIKLIFSGLDSVTYFFHLSNTKLL